MKKSEGHKRQGRKMGRAKKKKETWTEQEGEPNAKV